MLKIVKTIICLLKLSNPLSNIANSVKRERVEGLKKVL